MKDALIAKFTQHQEIREILLSTGDSILIEHTFKDSYWGDGGDGHGKNKLGILLMEVREELKESHPMKTNIQQVRAIDRSRAYLLKKDGELKTKEKDSEPK